MTAYEVGPSVHEKPCIPLSEGELHQIAQQNDGKSVLYPL